ncbi:MAG: phage head closure protein [Bacteroidetes bacterium]|nr:phage head closure protein [Bacteroidota bacterium]
MNRTDKKTMATEARHRITVQKRKSNSDGQGGHAISWESTGQYWAAIYPIKAQQQYDYNSIGVDATHHIKMRGYSTINDRDYRIQYGSRVFEVLTVENLQERDFELFITCKEVR